MNIMNSNTIYLKLKSDIGYSFRILSLSVILSIIGLLSGIISIIFERIWISIPEHYSIFIIMMSAVLLTISLIVFRNTRKLIDVVKTVNFGA